MLSIQDLYNKTYLLRTSPPSEFMDGKFQSVVQGVVDATRFFQLPEKLLYAVWAMETSLTTHYCNSVGLLHEDGHGHGCFGADDRFNQQIGPYANPEDPKWLDFDIDFRQQVAQCALRLSQYHQTWPNWRDACHAYNTGSPISMIQNAYGTHVIEAQALLSLWFHGRPCAWPLYYTDMYSRGDTGIGVAYIQARLAGAISKTATDWYWVDGSFGLGTEAAVVEFQTVRNLERDGIVGPATWAEMAR